MRAFSPDGAYVYYAVEAGTPAALFRVAIVGGAVRRVADGNFGRETLSPDGSRFTGRPPDGRDHSLLIVNTDGTGVRTLATLPAEVFRSAWSPDGKFIVVAVQGSGLVVSANEIGGGGNQLWLVSWPDGGVRRITNDTTEYGEVQVLADGKTIVATQGGGSEQTLWVAPAGKVDAAVRVSGESVPVPVLIALSNGRALYTTGSRDQGADLRAWPPTAAIGSASLPSGSTRARPFLPRSRM